MQNHTLYLLIKIEKLFIYNSTYICCVCPDLIFFIQGIYIPQCLFLVIIAFYELILKWSWRVFLCIVFQVHLWPTLLSASAHGRGYCAWWVSYFIMGKWEWRSELLFLHVKCLCVCRSVSAGFSRVTCSRAAAAASYGGVGSGSRTSAGAYAGLRNPGHTFRIADPQKRGRSLCCPTSRAGVTATSRLTLVTKLSRDANETCWTLVEAWWKRKGKTEGNKHERRLWERCCPMLLNNHCQRVIRFCWCLQKLKLHLVYSYQKIFKSLCFVCSFFL